MGSFHPGAKSARRIFTGGVVSAEQDEDLMLGSIWMHVCVCVQLCRTEEVNKKPIQTIGKIK